MKIFYYYVQVASMSLMKCTYKLMYARYFIQYFATSFCILAHTYGAVVSILELLIFQHSLNSTVVHHGYDSPSGMTCDRIGVMGVAKTPSSVLVNNKTATFNVDKGVSRNIQVLYKVHLLILPLEVLIFLAISCFTANMHIY